MDRPQGSRRPPLAVKVAAPLPLQRPGGRDRSPHCIGIGQRHLELAFERRAAHPHIGISEHHSTGYRVQRRKVEEVFVRKSDHLRLLQLRSPTGEIQELRTTDNHPFWTPEGGCPDTAE